MSVIQPTTTTTYCGFPKVFSSSMDGCGQDQGQEQGVRFYINKLWRGKGWEFLPNDPKSEVLYLDTEDVGPDQVSVDGFKLPDTLPQVVCAEDLVEYLQELLDLNNYGEMILILDTATRNFEILTQVEFLERLEYPVKEYHRDGYDVLHNGYKNHGIVLRMARPSKFFREVSSACTFGMW